MIEALRAQFGAAQVLSGADALPFERDWRGQFPGRALAVLCPRSSAELQAMVRASQPLPLVPQGGNTGLVGGSTADASGGELIVSMRRLNRVRALDRLDLCVQAEAGCVLATLQQAAAAQGLLLPLSMASEGSCTLGGNLATNAGGTQVLHWGNARELCLGLELVLADGTLLSDLDGLRKDHRGLNLRDLFIGSEGTLGLITAAVMKLVPAPRCRIAAWVGLDSLDATISLLLAARDRLGDQLSGFELMNAEVQALLGAELPLPATPWAVLLELSSSVVDEALLRDALGQLLEPLGEAVVAHNQAQFERLWALRESIPERQTRAGGNLKHDISLPLSRMTAFLAEVETALQQLVPGLRPQVFGHLGDGNLHFNLAPPAGMALAQLRQQHGEALTRCVFDRVAAFGGSFSAEHGIGRLRRDELARTLEADRLEWMRRVKRLFDPTNRMNPGRVLG